MTTHLLPIGPFQSKRLAPFYAFLFLGLLTRGAFAAETFHISQIGPPPIPGEMESMLPGTEFRFVTSNDVLGPTDKLMTGGSTLSFGWAGKYYSIRARFSWMLVAPIFQYDNDAPLLEEPIGRLADWRRQQLMQAFVLPLGSWKLKLQMGISNNDVGDKGIDEIQKWVHQLINDDYYLDRVEPSIQHHEISSFGGVSLFTPELIGKGFQCFVGGHYADDFFFPQKDLSAGCLLDAGRNFRMLAKHSWVWTRNSGFYEDLILPYRTQSLLSFQIYKYWNPSFGHSSVYLLGDRQDQYYIGLLNAGFDF